MLSPAGISTERVTMLKDSTEEEEELLLVEMVSSARQKLTIIHIKWFPSFQLPLPKERSMWTDISLTYFEN